MTADRRRLAMRLAVAAAAVTLLAVAWTKLDPLRKHPWLAERWLGRQAELMRHPDPRIGAAAWAELREAYMTSWPAFQVVLRLADRGDEARVAFLVERVSFPVPGQAARDGFWASAKPVYYKSADVPCRTVGEALLAVIYNERKWSQDYAGDWSAWWRATRGVYGLR